MSNVWVSNGYPATLALLVQRCDLRLCEAFRWCSRSGRPWLRGLARPTRRSNVRQEWQTTRGHSRDLCVYRKISFGFQATLAARRSSGVGTGSGLALGVS